MLLPVSHQRIVARFRREGKPVHAWKSRIFNNLGCTLRAGPACIAGCGGAGLFPPCAPGGPPAIVVLVERGGPFVGTRPTKAIFQLHDQIQTKNQSPPPWNVPARFPLTTDNA